MIYLALIFIIMPIVPGGKENVEKTVVAKKVLELVPTVTNEIESINNNTTFNPVNKIIKIINRFTTLPTASPSPVTSYIV